MYDYNNCWCFTFNEWQSVVSSVSDEPIVRWRLQGANGRDIEILHSAYGFCVPFYMKPGPIKLNAQDKATKSVSYTHLDVYKRQIL